MKNSDDITGMVILLKRTLLNAAEYFNFEDMSKDNVNLSLEDMLADCLEIAEILVEDKEGLWEVDA